jgi:hypothetical protein
MLWNENECGKNEGKKNLKETILSADCDRSERTGERGILQLLG